MNCPACKRVLEQLTVGDVTVDACRGGCGGIWFDNLELEKFDEPHEAAGEVLQMFNLGCSCCRFESLDHLLGRVVGPYFQNEYAVIGFDAFFD